MNVSNFDRQAKAEQKRVVAEATEFFRGVGLELYRSLVQDAKQVAGYGSPVASGRFAASMRLSVNGIDTSVDPGDPNYRYKIPLPPRTRRNVPISRVNAKLRTFKLGDKIYISNSLPYSRRIEIGGHSWQTPFGAFKPTVDRIVVQFRGVNLRVRNG